MRKTPPQNRPPAAGDLLDALADALTPGQAARRCGVHVATVYRWMDRGAGGVRLDFLKVGGRKRMIPRADLEGFVRALTRRERRDDAGPAEPSESRTNNSTAIDAELAAAGW